MHRIYKRGGGLQNKRGGTLQEPPRCVDATSKDVMKLRMTGFEVQHSFVIRLAPRRMLPQRGMGPAIGHVELSRHFIYV